MKKLLVVLFSIMFLAGCGTFNNKGFVEDCSDGFHLENNICVEDVHPAGSFTSSSDIINLFHSFNEKQTIVNRYFGRFVMFTAEALDDSVATDYSTEAGSNDYSKTNNQVEGVDEMDNVLTDGKYIYIQNYNRIQIALAYTQSNEYNDLSLVKEITFDALDQQYGYFYFTGMYVDDDRLIVVGTSYTYTCQNGDIVKEVPTEDGTDAYVDCSYMEYHSYTNVLEYSKDDFTLQNEYQLSGYFTGSRKINDNLYIVTNEYIPFYLEDNENYNFNLDNYLPQYKVNGTEVDLGYESVLYIDSTNPTTFTTFYGINLATKEVSTEVVLGEGGYNLYVSLNNIYLTGTKWNYNYDVLHAMEDSLDSENDVLIEQDPYKLSTSIVKMSINDGVVDFVANQEVPGIATDQFAMDEHDGYLRIVTTEQNWWWGWWGGSTNQIDNYLIVLDENLQVVSTLDGIGKEGESVQATRFVGNFAYVVTFLRTDPFYVIDLTDPTNPIKLSELEIPGFSDYLQPLGENYMLGIGYGDNDGGTQGFKISLYDVSDKSNAVVASELIYPYDNSYMWSSTTYNHKDLLVSIDKGIIALPYTLYTYSYSNNNYYNHEYHTGILVLNIDLDNGTISERARVEHSDTSSYDTRVYKSKFISDYFYTISSKYIMVSTLSDPETILKSIEIGTARDLEVPIIID